MLCVLSNPPLTDGARTLARLELARAALGASDLSVWNLFPEATTRTGDISRIGQQEAPWLSAREHLTGALTVADLVLLAHGVGEPSGHARKHYRAQVSWLQEQLSRHHLSVYRFGDGPRHPSRWQRWTSRTYPGVPFAEAVERSLMRVDLG